MACEGGEFLPVTFFSSWWCATHQRNTFFPLGDPGESHQRPRAEMGRGRGGWVSGAGGR